MALEALKYVKKIGGFKVAQHYPTGKERFAGTEVDQFVTVNHQDNSILFEIQDGPIKEDGVNGCQVDTMIEASKLLLEGFNKEIPCRETSMMITKLDEALMWSLKRKTDRQERDVEGTSKA